MAQGYSYDLPAMQSIGYREIGQYLQGQLTLDDAIASQQQATRRYARRQLTWFRRDERIHWLPAATTGLADFLDASAEGRCRQCRSAAPRSCPALLLELER